MSEKRKIVPVIEIEIKEDRVVIYLPLDFEIVRICMEQIFHPILSYLGHHIDRVRRGDCE